MACKHEDFKAEVKIVRLEDSNKFMCEIKVNCAECGVPFQFNGLQPGIDTNGARVSIDGLEANISISPQGVELSPLHRMMFNVNRSN